MVTVTEVDVARKRISLSMKDSSPSPVVRKSVGPKPAAKKEEPVNDFQAKLMELRKKFK